MAEEAGRNLFFNSGFELGLAGYGFVKHLRPETNPKMVYEGLVIDAKASGGKACLRVPNRFGESCEIYVKEVRIKPATRYTISLDMRSEAADASVPVIFLSITDQWRIHGQTFKVTTEWKRYRYSFTTGTNTPLEYNLMIRHSWESNDGPGDLWVDNLQVQEGSETEYRPAADLELAPVCDRNLFIAGREEKFTVATVLVNQGDREAKGNLALNQINDLTRERKPLTTLAFSLRPGDRLTLPYAFMPAEFGSFTVEATVDVPGAVSIPGDYAAIEAIEKKLVDLDRTLVVGVNGGIGQPGYRWAGKAGYAARAGNQEDYIRLLSEMGCRLLRAWDTGAPFGWENTEPERGRFTYEESDLLVALGEKYGLRILPVLGNSSFLCSDTPPKGKFKANGWPAWVKEAGRKRTEISDFWKKGGIEYMGFPPLDLWEQYVRNIAKRYDRRLTHFEIVNEPNIYITAEEYVPYLKAAYKALKAVNPSNRVVGFCSTGDLGGNMSQFLQECFALGGLDYADAVSFHPYHSYDLSALMPADKAIADMGALMQKAGAKRPIWNTEMYYLRPGKTAFEKANPSGEYAGHRYLTDLGEGVAQSIPIENRSLFKNRVTEYLQNSGSMTEFLPGPMYAVYNACVRLFEGSRPYKKIRWANDSICYVYERDGAYTAAFWHYGTLANLAVKLPLDEANAELYDLFGNKRPLTTAPLPLLSRQWFVKWKGKSPDDFIAALSAAQITSPTTVSLGAAHLIPRADGGWALAATVANQSSKPLPVRAGATGEGVVAEAIAGATLEPGAFASFAIPVAFKKGPPAAARVRVWADGKMTDFPVALGPLRQTVVVGRTPGKAVELARLGRGERPAVKASFLASRDDKGLVLAVQVKDATPSGDSGARNPWEQDCLEFFLDAEPAAAALKAPDAYHGRVARLFVLPYAPKGKQVVCQKKDLEDFVPGKISVIVTARPAGYDATVRIPWTALGVADKGGGELLGFDLAVDDAVGAEKAQSQILWNSSGDAYKNRLGFGFLRFE
ncbi:MAG: hypothetical protein J0L75_09540 [Spirochaetes bacterium]|nr:hypothetical protein [Spirochaetota bacterium]